MTSSGERRQWLDAMHADTTSQERLFNLIASLANLLDKKQVIETIRSVLGIEPVYRDDCVIFDELAVRFGEDDRVKSISRTIDGSHEPRADRNAQD